MWGNLHGWLISAVLAALILAPVAWLISQSRMSAPTGIALDSANLEALAEPMSPDDAWPIFTDDADAGDIYRQVIDGWNDDTESACRLFVQSPGGDIPPLIQLLIHARHCRRMALFSPTAAVLINYDNTHPPLENLYSAGEWAYKAGLSLHLHGQSATARSCLEAAFALGRQLHDERVDFDEFQKGVQLMADAAGAMCRVERPATPLYNRLTDFQRQMSDYQDRRVQPIWETISSVEASVIDRSAGDVLAMATLSQDRMWRVEATLKLGRYRYDAGSFGDQVGAIHAVHQLAADPDPAVAAAAVAAENLTIEKYRMIQ
jgi:hypothetical protein